MYVTNTLARPDPISMNTAAAPQQQQIAREIKQGAHLFRQGDEAHRIYKVLSGVLRLSRINENGRRQIISFGYAGDIVGFPSRNEHGTDCDALTDALVVSYQRKTLEHCDANPELHRQLMRAALGEISDMQDHFMMLGQKSASEKVASLLCVLTDRVGEPLGHFTQITLPMSRADIADFLGLTTETVSRSLTQLRKCKIIAIDKIHSVIILKPSALLTIAQGDD